MKLSLELMTIIVDLSVYNCLQTVYVWGRITSPDRIRHSRVKLRSGQMVGHGDDIMMPVATLALPTDSGDALGWRCPQD